MRPLGIVASARVGAPFAPTGSPALWLDAADPATFTYSSGVLVSQWSDKSGNGRHATQGTPAYQPTRNGTQNGRTTVAFGGQATGQILAGAAPVSTAVDNWTMMVAAKVTAPDGDGCACPWLNGQGNGYGPAFRSVPITKAGWLRGGIAWHPATGANVGAVWAVVTLRRSAGTTTFWLNGTADATTWTDTPNAPGSAYRVGGHDPGGRYRVECEIGDAIFWGSALSDPDIATNTNGLKSKWGIA